jgi:hypothetical protein
MACCTSSWFYFPRALDDFERRLGLMVDWVLNGSHSVDGFFSGCGVVRPGEVCG